ncbi:leupaxin-like isoform X11 [Gordionus sp. m RMFG-2023]|uniref:leupaxin-like isoform X11 n=1 Tax=Gordionus sp. m RMFG-2023 TaxID=3053472 RepID=UPI0031FCE58F
MGTPIIDHSKRVMHDLDFLLTQLDVKNQAFNSYKPPNQPVSPNIYKEKNLPILTAIKIDNLLKELDPEPSKHRIHNQKSPEEIKFKNAYLSLSPTQLTNESKINVQSLLAELNTVIRESPSKIKSSHTNIPPHISTSTSSTEKDCSSEENVYSSIGEARRSVVYQSLNKDDPPNNGSHLIRCCHCNNVISDQSIHALGKDWHPEHFRCSQCKREIGTQNFFEYKGLPFCESDYHELFSPRCAACKKPILEKCVTALDRTWHPEHFKCVGACSKIFEPGEPYHVISQSDLSRHSSTLDQSNDNNKTDQLESENEDQFMALCREDYFALFAPRCRACANPILENFVSALDAKWHPDCFVCGDCHMPFGKGSFYEFKDQDDSLSSTNNNNFGWPLCYTHYMARKKASYSLCFGCGREISPGGKCVSALYKKFHPEHFVCAFCLKQLGGTFKERRGKPYCHTCFDKLL